MTTAITSQRVIALAGVALTLLFTCAAGRAAGAGGRQVEQSLIDHAVLYQDSISKAVPVRVTTFSAESADLGTGAKKNKPKYRLIAEDMQENAPRLMLSSLIDRLKEGGFEDVAATETDQPMPDPCLIIEGEFTMLNPGSQGKRYVVGFGAGKSKVCASGRVVDAQGEPLMEFDHCRHEAIGLFGGDSGGQMAKDSHASGVHLAEFMVKWAEGAYAN